MAKAWDRAKWAKWAEDSLAQEGNRFAALNCMALTSCAPSAPSHTAERGWEIKLSLFSL